MAAKISTAENVKQSRGDSKSVQTVHGMNKFLIKHPWISEKATAMSAFGKYVFLVNGAATSPEVKKVVEAHYKVHVVRVQVVNAKPKQRRLGRSIGVKPGYKKAIVTLKAGEKLDVLPH